MHLNGHKRFRRLRKIASRAELAAGIILVTGMFAIAALVGTTASARDDE